MNKKLNFSLVDDSGFRLLAVKGVLSGGRAVAEIEGGVLYPEGPQTGQYSSVQLRRVAIHFYKLAEDLDKRNKVKKAELPFKGANAVYCDNPNGPCYCGAWHKIEEGE